MRKHSTKNTFFTLLILCLPLLGMTQTLAPWQTEHSKLNSTYFATENSKPNPTSFDNIIGTSGGKEIGNFFHNGFHAEGVINSFRSFHLMEADFGDAYFPRDQALPIIDCDCGEALYGCPESQKCPEGSNGQNDYGFRGYKATYCDWVNEDNFKIREVYAALECQIPIKSTYCKTYGENGVCLETEANPCLINDGRENLDGRKFPDKWYSLEEWGGINNIQQHTYNYVHSFAGTFCPKDTSKDCVVKVLELGNEPWGNQTPGRLGYHALLRGAVNALKDYYGTDKTKWRMRLSTAALDARFACDNAPMQYVHDMIPDDLDVKYYLDYLNVHNYPFIKTPCGLYPKDMKLAYTPESPNGGFLALKNMDEWRRLNGMEHTRINITEFGWNSDQEDCNFGVGQANQAAYLMRANLIAARFDIHKVFNYLLKDQPKYYNTALEQLVSPESPLYCSTGLIDKTGNKKPSFFATETLVKKLAGKHFLKAVEENYTEEGKIFAFLLGDYNETTKEGKPTHLVAWRSKDLGVSDNNNIQYPERDSEKGLPLTTISLPSPAMNFSKQDTFFYLGWEGGHAQIIGGSLVTLDGVEKHQVKVDLSGLPIVIPIKDGGCRYDENGILDNCSNDATMPGNTGTEENGTSLTCGTINITYGDNWIKWTGKDNVNYPKVELVNISDFQYKIAEICPSNCGNSQTFTDLAAGDYIVKVFDPSWNLACQLEHNNKIQLTGGSGNPPTTSPCANAGGDNDNDGICAWNDCNDNDPNYPKQAGTACNDANPNTQNDKIQADGCACLGETIATTNNNLSTLTCDEVTIRYGNGQITFEGKAAQSYHFKYQLKEGDYRQKDCHDCGSNKIFIGLIDGPYEVIVNYQSCGIIDLTASDGNSETCEDNDGDGVCNDQDCAPWDNTLPKPVGSSCDDNNPNTQNDKIQADGCTCEGTANQNGHLTTETCEEITINYGYGTIEMVGLPNKSYTFSIHDMNNGWKKIFECWNYCGSSQKVTGLRASQYKVNVYGGTIPCTTDVTLETGASSRALPNDLIELGTRMQAQTIYLDWAAGRLDDTESFVLEKSLDGTNFKSIQIITPYTLNAQDNGPDYGVNYYRIKQQFLNGESRYSPIREEAYYLDESAISIFPNPATSIVNISTGHFSNLEGEVFIFNRLGYEVANQKLQQSGERISFDTSAFTSGIYFMVIKPKNGKMQTRQFMVANE